MKCGEFPDSFRIISLTFVFIFSSGRYQGSGGSWGTATALTTDLTGLMRFTDTFSFLELANLPNISWYRGIVPVLCIPDRQESEDSALT